MYLIPNIFSIYMFNASQVVKKKNYLESLRSCQQMLGTYRLVTEGKLVTLLYCGVVWLRLSP